MLRHVVFWLFCMFLLNMVKMLTESWDFSKGICSNKQWLHFFVDVGVKVISTLRLRFSHRPIFRISSSSMRGCGWNFPEARRYAEKTQIVQVLLFCVRFIQHTCWTEAITNVRWVLIRNSPVHTAAAGQAHSALLGPYWACAARQEAGVWFVEHSPVCAVITVILWLIQPSERGWVGGCCINCVLWADTPRWSLFVCCVMERGWGMKTVKPPLSSTEQVVSRLG